MAVLSRQEMASSITSPDTALKPFIWSATVEDIIKKIDRVRVKMEQIKPRSTQPREKRSRLFCKVIYGTYRELPNRETLFLGRISSWPKSGSQLPLPAVVLC